MINLFIFGHGVVIFYFLACLRSTFFSLLKQLYFKCSLSTIVQTFELDWLLNLRSGWLGQAMVLGSFQCQGVLLLWHMVGQGPAVLSAGAGWVGFFCVCFFFHLVYPIFLLQCLICWETAGHSEILWSRLLQPSGSCQLLPGTCSPILVNCLVGLSLPWNSVNG